MTPRTILIAALLMSMIGRVFGQHPSPDAPGQYTVELRTRGATVLNKLSPALQRLYTFYTTVPRPRQAPFSPEELRLRFGIRPDDRSPIVGVSVDIALGTGDDVLRSAGLTWYSRRGQQVLGSVAVMRLLGVARIPEVKRISEIAPPRPPAPVKTSRTRGRGAEPTDLSFDRQGLTGKGVYVGIIDTGIDWGHPDFLDESGGTRIAWLWDTTDASYQNSNGKVGQEPPLPIGTLYSSDDIRAALKKRGAVHSKDTEGHGTQCAGAAAGRGLVSGMADDAAAGIAQEARLLVCRVSEGEGPNPALVGAGLLWMAAQAKQERRPVVISLSFGWHMSPHDGTDPIERLIDQVSGPGCIVCAAAGNNGGQTIHGRGDLVRPEPELTVLPGKPLRLTVRKSVTVAAYLPHGSGWGVSIGSWDWFRHQFTVRTKPIYVAIEPSGQNAVRLVISRKPERPDEMVNELRDKVTYSLTPNEGSAWDQFVIKLEPGDYSLQAFGTAGAGKAQKAPPTYSVYLPHEEFGTFTEGAVQEGLVSSPGTSAAAITVGSFDCRGSWPTADGGVAGISITPGRVSSFSSRGFVRGDVAKPDVLAPGCMLISALSSDAPGAAAEKLAVYRGGEHVAWAGTSASTPWLAGLIALMLQHDPQLTPDAVRRILRETAKRDAGAGAVPTPIAGYGKVDPGAALRTVIHGRKGEIP